MPIFMIFVIASYKDDNDKKTDGLHRHRCESSIYIDPNTEGINFEF